MQDFPIEDQIISTNGEVIPGTWELTENNTLQIVQDSDVLSYEIVKFSDDILQLKSEPVTVEDFDIDEILDAGLEVTLKGYYLLTFSK